VFQAIGAQIPRLEGLEQHGEIVADKEQADGKAGW
jgi:hypothetical protein